MALRILFNKVSSEYMQTSQTELSIIVHPVYGTLLPDDIRREEGFISSMQLSVGSIKSVSR